MKKSIVELFTYAAAASFFALPPYGLAAHWYGVVLLAVSVLPAVGMSLLLTKFCRSGIPAAVRFAPVAAGWFALVCANRHLAGSGTASGAFGLTVAPLAVAVTIMPAACYALYWLERNEALANRIVNAARLPLAAVALMALVMAFPSIGAAMMFRPGAALFPGGWRMLGCHFVHFGWDHFAWDGAVVLAVGTMLAIRRGELFFCRLFLASLLWCGAGVAVFGRGYDLYCGSSGIGCALAAALAVDFIRSGGGTLRRASAAVLAGIAGKAVFELASGETLFVPGTEFEPAAAAHLAGMLAGVWHALPLRKLRIVRRYLAARLRGLKKGDSGDILHELNKIWSL